MILLTEYNQDEFHLLHAQTVENTMRYFARELGFADEEDFWGIVGLLHDLGFEKYPEEHCIKSQEIMKERGIDEKIIHATASHGYAITVDIKPEHEMEKVLYAVDELTGLIGAVVLMRPSKSVQERVRTKFWTTIGLRKEPFYVFKRTKGYCTTDISSNRVCN
ncbi:hypothetical protein [Dorea longicatena]|uniref:hypothetical protein n=1 Tax=Dorea longicatena TaxID=88431 RepID=UPI0034A2D78C